MNSVGDFENGTQRSMVFEWAECLPKSSPFIAINRRYGHRGCVTLIIPVAFPMFPSIPRLLEAVSLPFKRSQLGLFHGKTKQYGNNVPFSKKKTRRTWLPNVQRKRVYSETLGDMVRLKLTTRALRSIKKVRTLWIQGIWGPLN